jgi:hypothetical protein
MAQAKTIKRTKEVAEMTKQNNRKANHSTGHESSEITAGDYRVLLLIIIIFDRRTEKKRVGKTKKTKNKRNQSIFQISTTEYIGVSQIYFKSVPQKSQTSAPQSSSVRQPIVSMYTYYRREREIAGIIINNK